MVTPEEYESVRMQSPEQCESYLVPIVGSKSAYQLMDPALLQQVPSLRLFTPMLLCADLCAVRYCRTLWCDAGTAGVVCRHEFDRGGEKAA